MALMIPTVLVLMVAHGIEVIVWSFAYAIVSAAADDANLVYFAFVNYTTLGYGDVLPLPRWRLLGPITAMNGVLLFGWSTAVIFEVLRRTLARTPGFRNDRRLGTTVSGAAPYSDVVSSSRAREIRLSAATAASSKSCPENLSSETLFWRSNSSIQIGSASRLANFGHSISRTS
jgi:hypothetical protein